MSRKKEPCRNFLRGSCQYGDRCKFLHVNQQSKPSPFAFGAQNTGQSFPSNQQQQQKSNPFGFGSQSSIQSKPQNQVKPFENKWSRFSPISSTATPPTRHNDAQAQGATHRCTDPEACKRQIAEDLQSERPLWKLTCYGHSKNRPCDVFGDTSYEELRARAYADARQGSSLQSIIDRERSLLNSKIIEFENLLRNPYVIPQNASSSGPRVDNRSSSNPLPFSSQNNAPPTVTSFSQLGSSPNWGSGGRTLASPSNAFGQPNPFSVPISTSAASGLGSSTFGSPGFFGSQQPMQQFGNATASNFQQFNMGSMNLGSNLFSTSPVASTNFAVSANYQLPIASNITATGVGQASNDAKSLADTEAGKDKSIWLKPEWKRGEIPEEAPPDALI